MEEILNTHYELKIKHSNVNQNHYYFQNIVILMLIMDKG